MWPPFKCAFGDVGIPVRHFVQCQVQMAAAHVPADLLVLILTHARSSVCRSIKNGLCMCLPC